MTITVAPAERRAPARRDVAERSAAPDRRGAADGRGAPDRSEGQPRPGVFRHLEVVPPRSRSPQTRRRRARLVAGAGVIVAFVAVFGLVGIHVLLAQGQFRLAHLQGQADDAQARYIRLRLEVAQLESPERIVAAAQERLGMVAPSSVTYLTPTGATAGPAGHPPEGPGVTRAGTPGADQRAGSGPPAGSDPPTEGTQQWAAVKPALSSRP
jgi:cell division protein FtsL